jgi:hypothetical protein
LIIIEDNNERGNDVRMELLRRAAHGKKRNSKSPIKKTDFITTPTTTRKGTWAKKYILSSFVFVETWFR